jgi:hypothetical protein
MAAVSRKLGSGNGLMVFKMVTPRTISESDCALCGAHDVGEEHGRKDRPRSSSAADTGQELLDVAENLGRSLS